MSDARAAIEAALQDALKRVAPDAADVVVTVERPKQAEHGDYASNVALLAAKRAKRNPRELAGTLREDTARALAGTALSVDVAGPGFLNYRLAPAIRQSVVHDVLARAEAFGRSDARRGE